MQSTRMGQVLAIHRPGECLLSNVTRESRGSSIASDEGFGLLCCISSHVMNLTSVDSLARDLTQYAGAQLGFDAVAVYVESRVGAGDLDADKTFKLVAHYPSSTVPFRSAMSYEEAVSLFSETDTRSALNDCTIPVTHPRSEELDLVYVAIPGTNGLGGFIILARSGHDPLTDDWIACLRAMAAALSGALKRDQMICAMLLESCVDPLTGAYDRRYLHRRFAGDLVRTVDAGESITLVFADINGMKKINDSLGHQTGDEVLKRFVRCVAASIRSSDYIVRYGGDEFIVVLGNTDSDSARRVIERVKKRLSETVLDVGLTGLPFPGSAFGFAEAPGESVDLTALLKLADARMYEDKVANASVTQHSTDATA